jgi:peptidoglycan/xylan/chitin deacetylase (PgdA/CDA1 family)
VAGETRVSKDELMLSRVLPNAKSAAKMLLHRSGALGLGRSLNARNALTVVLFHRVLPLNDPRAKTADWTYAVRLDHFERFLDFVRGAYSVVSLKQVEEAYRNSTPLPPKPFLITFDDAWEDTARHAVPALEKRKLASAIFVPTAGVGDDLLIWQDVVGMLARAGALDNRAREPKTALAEFEKLAPQDRNQRLRTGLARAGDSVAPVMMSKAQFASLPERVDLGGHGVNHIRFTEMDDVSEELTGSYRSLRELTGAAPRSFAFPHGAYHPHHVGEAHGAGYDLVFTTVKSRNRLKDGKLCSPVLARITISDYDMLDRHGRFSESQLAYALLARPAVVLEDVRPAT